MEQILSNYLLVLALSAWVSAQLIKVLITLITGGKFSVYQLWGSGGMPSSHTASVCALSVGTAKLYGLDSPLFAIVLIGSLIVVHDALGVRRQAGEHAKALNFIFDSMPEIVEPFQSSRKRTKGKTIGFSELIGHTPFQVLMGAILGIGLGIGMPMF